MCVCVQFSVIGVIVPGQTVLKPCPKYNILLSMNIKFYIFEKTRNKHCFISAKNLVLSRYSPLLDIYIDELDNEYCSQSDCNIFNSIRVNLTFINKYIYKYIL